MAVGDEHIQQWCRDEVAACTDAVPRWITDLPDLTVGRAIRLIEAFEDLDEVLFEVRLADGRAITCGVLIDHLEYSTVKDVGIWAKPLNAVLVLLESWEWVGRQIKMTTADARAWIEQAFGKCIGRPVRQRRPGSRPWSSGWLLGCPKAGGNTRAVTRIRARWTWWRKGAWVRNPFWGRNENMPSAGRDTCIRTTLSLFAVAAMSVGCAATEPSTRPSSSSASAAASVSQTVELEAPLESGDALVWLSAACGSPSVVDAAPNTWLPRASPVALYITPAGQDGVLVGVYEQAAATAADLGKLQGQRGYATRVDGDGRTWVFVASSRR